MKYYELGIVALALAGCSDLPRFQHEPVIEEVITGEPLSVQMTPTRYGTSLSTAVVDEFGKLRTCDLTNNFVPTQTYTALAALIDSEINDADAEKVKIYGRILNGGCIIKSVEANGETIIPVARRR
jgi:hypothetical protein